MHRVKVHAKITGIILVFLIGLPVFFVSFSQADNDPVLLANPSEISITLYRGENTTENIAISNNGSTDLSGELGIWGITYNVMAPTIRISGGSAFSIEAGETVDISVEIWAGYDPVEFSHWNFTIWFSGVDYFQIITLIHVHTVFPEHSAALHVDRREIKAVMFQNQYRAVDIHIKNMGYEGFSGILNISGYEESGSPHVEILLNNTPIDNISFIPKEVKNITLKLYAGDEAHTGKTWNFILTFKACNSSLVRNLTAIHIYTENIKEKLETIPEKYDLYLEAGEEGHVYVTVKNKANITVNGSIGGAIPLCGCLKDLECNPENLTLEPGEEKTIDVKITINSRTEPICGEGACSIFGMSLLLENSTAPWDDSLREPYAVHLSTIYIYPKKEENTGFTILMSAIVIVSLLLVAAIYRKKRKM